MRRVRCADRRLTSQANQGPVRTADPTVLAYSSTRLLAYSPFHPLGRVVAHRWARRWHASAGLAGGSKRASRILATRRTSTHGLPRARRRPAPASGPDGQATCIPNALADKPARPDLVGPYELLRTARDRVVPAGNSSEPKARGHWRRTPWVRPSAVCPTPPPVLVLL